MADKDIFHCHYFLFGGVTLTDRRTRPVPSRKSVVIPLCAIAKAEVFLHLSDRRRQKISVGGGGNIFSGITLLLGYIKIILVSFYSFRRGASNDMRHER